MYLTPEQQGILDGAKGETMARVWKTLVMYGEVFGADKLVPVTSEYNHLVTSFGLKMMKPVFDLMQQLIDAGTVSQQPFSVDPRPLDKNVPANFLMNFIFNNFMYSKQDDYEKQLKELGLMNDDAFSCACYLDQMGNKPKKGEVLSWAESSAVVYANSVLGARCNRNSGIMDIMGSIAGCVPNFGLLTDEYLQKYGYNDVVVTTVLHEWMGGFPADEAKAFGVISWGAAAAALGKATKVIVKSPHEAVGIPTMEANAEGMRCTKQIVNMLKDQVLVSAELEQEKEIIRQETRAIVDKCFELGKGDIAVGAVRGVEAGVIDIPFAPCRFNAGKMLPARDNNGAIRILNMGNLPFSKELVDFHKAKIDERAKAEKRGATFQMVIDDVYAIGKGNLVGRPKL